MKFKMWNYIHQSKRNSMRNAKNTVEGGLACVVCEIWAKTANNGTLKKFKKSIKLNMWNYIHQSTRNSMRNAKNTVEGGLACVVCEIWAKNRQQQSTRMNASHDKSSYVS